MLSLSGCHALFDADRIAVPDAPHTIYLIYRDWHTSVMIDAVRFRELSTMGNSENLMPELEDARYLRVGWGDGEYFTGRSTSIGTATRALFLSGYSALQFLGYENDPFEYIPAETRVPLAISDEDFAALVRYIDDSVARDLAGQTQPLPAYVDNAGVFLRSSKRYGLFNNCNSWSSEALQAAGLPIRSAFRLTAHSVFDQARAIADYQQGLRHSE